MQYKYFTIARATATAATTTTTTTTTKTIKLLNLLNLLKLQLPEECTCQWVYPFCWICKPSMLCSKA